MDPVSDFSTLLDFFGAATYATSSPCRNSRDSSAALAMVLWMIGLGLGDEGDISVKGLKAVQRMLDM